MSRLAACLLISVACLAACGEVEDTRPGQPVKQRQQAFKAMLRSFEPMGKMLRDQRYDTDRFAALAAELAALRDAPWPHFGPDTLYPPSKATAAVWQRAGDFERERLNFAGAVDRLQAAAGSRDKAVIEPAYKAVYDSCQSCHRDFRER